MFGKEVRTVEKRELPLGGRLEVACFPVEPAANAPCPTVIVSRLLGRGWQTGGRSSEEILARGNMRFWKLSSEYDDVVQHSKLTFWSRCMVLLAS